MADERVILHLDMDAFFAQVEHERLDIARDIPLAVQQWDGLIAVNYPARAAGVKRMMSAADALKACPQIVLARVGTQLIHEVGKEAKEAGKDMDRDTAKIDLERYREASRRVFGVLERECGVGSIVEKAERAGCLVAARLRAALLRDLKFTSSGGVAHCKMLAKQASALNKPNKQTVVPPSEAVAMLREIKVRDVRGLGGKLGDALCTLLEEIVVPDAAAQQQARVATWSRRESKWTAGDVVERIPAQLLLARLGEGAARYVLDRCTGIDNEPVVATGPPKSHMEMKSITMRDRDAARGWARMLVHFILSVALFNRQAVMVESGSHAITSFLQPSRTLPDSSRPVPDSQTLPDSSRPVLDFPGHAQPPSGLKLGAGFAVPVSEAPVSAALVSVAPVSTVDGVWLGDAWQVGSEGDVGGDWLSSGEGLESPGGEWESERGDWEYAGGGRVWGPQCPPAHSLPRVIASGNEHGREPGKSGREESGREPGRESAELWGKWACTRCTFLCSAEEPACSMCELTRFSNCLKRQKQPVRSQQLEGDSNLADSNLEDSNVRANPHDDGIPSPGVTTRVTAGAHAGNAASPPGRSERERNSDRGQKSERERERKRERKHERERESERERKSGSATPSTSGSPLAHASGGRMPWSCVACTFECGPGERTCTMCGALRGSTLAGTDQLRAIKPLKKGGAKPVR
ncbi:hypothetical protein T492DRAFT_1021447 [Pavlovales sp. CCMP2436]|nr:hypothetical protein T492DRAFT_1021447 [Pavlovales sp. CCMP2436]